VEEKSSDLMCMLDGIPYMMIYPSMISMMMIMLSKSKADSKKKSKTCFWEERKFNYSSSNI
jgi:hypothetical protein